MKDSAGPQRPRRWYTGLPAAVHRAPRGPVASPGVSPSKQALKVISREGHRRGTEVAACFVCSRARTGCPIPSVSTSGWETCHLIQTQEQGTVPHSRPPMGTWVRALNISRTWSLFPLPFLSRGTLCPPLPAVSEVNPGRRGTDPTPHPLWAGLVCGSSVTAGFSDTLPTWHSPQVGVPVASQAAAPVTGMVGPGQRSPGHRLPTSHGLSRLGRTLPGPHSLLSRQGAGTLLTVAPACVRVDLGWEVLTLSHVVVCWLSQDWHRQACVRVVKIRHT